MLKTNIDVSNGIIDIHSKEDGWFGLQFYIQCGEERLTPYDARVITLPKSSDSPRDSRISTLMEASLGDQLTLRLEIAKSANDDAVTVVPEIINSGTVDVEFSGYGFQLSNDAKGPFLTTSATNIYTYAHSENVRHEKHPHFTSTYPFIRPLPTNPIRFGDSPSNGIPALLIGTQGGSRWLMAGAMTQNKHLLSFEIGLPQSQNAPIVFETRNTWNGFENEVVPANSSVKLEGTVFSVFDARNDEIYKIYMRELCERHEFQGPVSRIAEEPVYCTWNFGICTNVNEEICLERMRQVAQVQKGGFFQLDHGYQPQLSGEHAPYIDFETALKTGENTPSTPELDAYYPDCSAAWDLSRFPSGPTGFVESCKSFGLRPGIWWSPRVAKDGIIQKDHPEWILLDKSDNPVDVGYFVLDTSLQDVRDFLESCVKTIVRKWGFEGMKLDFYSWTFDHPDAKFRNVGKTGVELKNWFFQMIRSYLGPKGYFLHCISCPLGNPFLAIGGFDAFRVGIDIHSGEWEYHVRSAKWLLSAIIATGRDTWLPNIDSCMGSPDIPANERRSRLAFAYITSGMLEFSGPIELLDEGAKQDYGTMCERLDTSGEISILDQHAFYGIPLPETILREHALDGETRANRGISHTIAFLNWTDDDKVIAFDFAHIGLGTECGIAIKDFWTGEKPHLDNGLFTAQLPARTSILLDIM